MGKNRIAIASVVLVILTALVVWKVQQRGAEVVAAPDVTVTLPAFKQGDIDELTFAAPERPKVRHVKQGDTWNLVEPVAAKSDQSAITTALSKLGELEVTGVAATKKENHGMLEVDPKKGTHVTAKAAGKTVLDVWIGSYRSGNSMLRKEGEDTVATVKGSIRFAFSKFLREWRDRSILDLDADHVQSVELSNPHGHFKFVKNGGAWAQAPGEKPIVRFDPERVKSLVSAIATIDASDFAEDGVTPEAAGVGAGAATVLVTTASDAGPGQTLLRIGNLKGSDRYLTVDGVPTLFLVSRWLADRLIGGADQVQALEETKEAAGGSAQNPIPVEPSGMQFHGGPGGAQDPAMQAQIQAMIKQAQAKPAQQAREAAPPK